MTTLARFTANMSDDEYQASVAALGDGLQAAPGFLLHASYRTGDSGNGRQVVEMWDSRQQAESWILGSVLPYFKTHAPGVDEPSIEWFEVDSTVAGSLPMGKSGLAAVTMPVQKAPAEEKAEPEEKPSAERPQVHVRNIYSNPDETREFAGHGSASVVRGLGGAYSIVLGRFEPGWSWEGDVKPISRTETCEVAHAGIVIAGKMGIRMVETDQVLHLEPGDVCVIPPGHHAWVEGDEECVFLDTGEEMHRSYAVAPSAQQEDEQSDDGQDEEQQPESEESGEGNQPETDEAETEKETQKVDA